MLRIALSRAPFSALSMARGTALAALLLAAAAPLSAAVTEVFVDDAVPDFRGGDVTTSTLTWDGFVSAPARRALLAKLEADIVWDAAPAGEGRYYIASGHEGALFELSGKNVKVLHKFEEPAVYAISVQKDGSLLAATSPGGRVYRFAKPGEAPKLFAETGQGLVWKLLPRPDGSVFAATGPEGRIVKIDTNGTTSTLARIEDTVNILDIIDDGPDAILAATQGKGLVARVKNDGTIFIMADSEQEEVRRLARRPDGTVIAAVNGVRSPGDRFFKRVPQTNPSGEKREPKPRDVSFVFSIFPDGYADELWPSPEVPIHDIALTDEGNLLVASGNKGSLYSIDPLGRTDVLGGSVEKILSRITPSGKGAFLLGTGDAATLQEIRPAESMPGTFESRVHNVKGSARWGRLNVLMPSAANGGIRVATRSGNTTKADKTWSPWSEWQDVASGTAEINSPTGRFIQYRLALDPASDGQSTRVDAVRLFYRQMNQKPVVTSFEIKATEPPKEAAKGGRGGAPGSLLKTGPVFVDPDMNQRSLDITWKAEDANGDTLVYQLFIQKSGTDRWIALGEEQSGTAYKLDTRGIPDGLHRFRIEARDYKNNPAGEERIGDAVSGFQTIDNTMPEIIRFEATPATSGRLVSIKAQDSATNIVAAAWRTDADDWNFLNTVDGIFDDRAELFEFTLPADHAKPGTVLTVLVTDDGGNTAVRSLNLD